MKSALLTLLVAGALLSAPALAQEQPADTKAVELTAADAVQQLLDEYDALDKAFWKAISAGVTDEEREALYENGRPDVVDFCNRFFVIARAHPGTEPALEALAWIVDNHEDQAGKGEALDLLVANHMQSEGLKDVCSGLSRNYSTSAQAALVKVLADSPHRDVRGHACYAHAKQLGGMAKIADRLQAGDADEGYINWYTGELGEERMAELGKLDLGKLSKQSEKLYERILAEFADVKTRGGTLGERATSNLFEIRNLQIGMVAPEIEGDDLDGVSFRLSDYRGKVVVLDFWGNW